MTTQYIYDLVDTWNASGTTFTAIKMDVTDTASASASLLMDLQVGSSSKFSVGKTGNVKASNGTAAIPAYGMGTIGIYTRASVRLNFAIGGSDVGIELGPNLLALQNTGEINWTASTLPSSAADLFLTRRAAANLRLGAADAAAPVAQTLSVQSVVAGTTNTAGTNLTITGSQGTGTGAGGSIIFQIAPLGSSGSAQNALATALTIGSDRVVTVAANASSLAQIAMADRGTVLSIYATAFGVQSLLVSAPGGLTVYNDTGSLALGAASDVKLFRDDANKLALRNSTAAQTFNLYGTYTDGSNYERLSFTSSGGNVDISTEKAGTGVVRPIRLFTTGSAALQFGTVNVLRWNIDTSGHFVANADNTYDIGASGATRPRTVYVGTDIHLGQYIRQATNLLYIVNGAGILQLSNASNTDFNRLQFGGTTSSFPAIKRSTTVLQARLADDSAFAPVQGKLTTDTAYTAGSIVATGYLTLYDSTGTAYRVPCVV